MRHLAARRLAGALAVGLTTALAAAQAPPPDAGTDSLLHAELTLDSQPISVAFPPRLPAAGGTHPALLAGVVGSRVRVGSLTAHRALRIGSLAPDAGAPPPAAADEAPERSVSRDLWLARTVQGWQLEARADRGPDPAIIPLAQRATDAVAPTFAASLHATAAEAGRLVPALGRARLERRLPLR